MIGNHSIGYRPLFGFRPHWGYDFELLNDSNSCSLKNVEKMISQGNISAANKEAEKISSLSMQAESYKKITEYHLKNGNLSEAFAASREINILSIQDECLKKITEYHLKNGNLSEAFAASREINILSNQDECLKKIVQGYLDCNDLANASEVLGHINFLAVRHEIGVKLMDLELNKGDLISSVRTCALIRSKDVAQRLADKILNSKPDLNTMYKIEENASQHLSSFPTLHEVILNALLALYKVLGNQEQADRLENKINNLDKLSLVNSLYGSERIFSLLAGLYTGCIAQSRVASLPVSLGVGIATTLAIRYPAARRVENLLGVGVGMAATAAGVTALPAVGMGLGTAFFARIPLVQAGPLAAFRAGSKAFKQAVTELPNFAYKLVKGIGTGVGNASEALISGAGKAIDVADYVLDKWTLRK